MKDPQLDKLLILKQTILRTDSPLAEKHLRIQVIQEHSFWETVGYRVVEGPGTYVEERGSRAADAARVL